MHALDRVPFRGDEAFTALNWVRQPLLTTLASDIPLRDPQPPLAYALFWFWGQLLGRAEFTLRFLPALVGALGVPALYALGVRLRGRQLGLVAALLWAVHPYAIWHSQDARSYALWSTFSLLALWLALSALSRRRFIDWVLYVIAAVAAAYVYYLELFVMVVINFFVVFAFWRRFVLLRWFSAQAVIALALAPWFFQERLLVGSGYGGTAQGADFARLFDWFLPALALGEALPAFVLPMLWPAVAVLVLLGFCSLRRACRLCAAFVVLLGVVPPLLLTLVSLRLDVFTPRYVLASAPAYTLALSGLFVFGASSLRLGRLSRWAVSLALFAWFILVGFVLVFYYRDYAKSPDWRALADYLNDRLEDEPLVIQTAADEAFTYYFDNRSDQQRLPANPHQSVEEITQVLEADQQQYTSIWLVANPPVEWQNANASAEWLAANMQLVRSSLLAGLPARQFMPWAVSAAELRKAETAEEVQFGDVARLEGVRVMFPVEPDGSLVTLIYWQPIKNAESDLKVFAHLVPADSQTDAPVAQDDQYPQDGRISSLRWAEHSLFRDVYALPVGLLPPGAYRLLIGLYDPESGRRVALPNGRDSYHAATIDLPGPQS
ncbi:MAG: glycosyltransferase family 39 protein [Aggregatilineales bacterium]